MKKKWPFRQRLSAGAASLRRVENILSGKKKPSRHTLDRLALLAGFQNWHDLREAVHGEAGAGTNFGEGENKKD